LRPLMGPSPPREEKIERGKRRLTFILPGEKKGGKEKGADREGKKGGRPFPFPKFKRCFLFQKKASAFPRRGKILLQYFLLQPTKEWAFLKRKKGAIDWKSSPGPEATIDPAKEPITPFEKKGDSP